MKADWNQLGRQDIVLNTGKLPTVDHQAFKETKTC